MHGSHLFLPASSFFSPTSPTFGHFGQLHLIGFSPCPALSRLLLKTSNTHNFWFIGPRIMKFVLTQSLLRGACSRKVSKKIKTIWDQVTLPKSGLVTPSTFKTTGVNHISTFITAQRYLLSFQIALNLFYYNRPHHERIKKLEFGTCIKEGTC